MDEPALDATKTAPALADISPNSLAAVTVGIEATFVGHLCLL
jgi:hypothetical protein